MQQSSRSSNFLTEFAVLYFLQKGLSHWAQQVHLPPYMEAIKERKENPTFLLSCFQGEVQSSGFI